MMTPDPEYWFQVDKNIEVLLKTFHQILKLQVQ